ncbi:hypothetical protein Q1695_014232 [Nippostrongylus brasiliensis]|nr:hypothetical protein Q1695_014232 [Nippostrongylus brasiliensis]
MLIWLIVPLAGVSTRPVLLLPIAVNDSTAYGNETLLDVVSSSNTSNTLSSEPLLVQNVSDNAGFQKAIDPSIFISLRQNDWRDNHQTKMIIWSLESPHHPDFGKNYPRGESHRSTTNSQLMSFLILGSVIGFILYTYLSHVILTRKLNRQLKAAQLRELVHRSAMIMAGSAQQNQLNLVERRRSLINLFKGFKL